MDRREALKKTAFAMGYTLTASALVTALQGCQPEEGQSEQIPVTGDWKPAFFDDPQIVLIAELCETILPETDTPGAKSVLVHQFIDDEVRYMLSVREQHAFIRGLEQVQALSQSTYGKNYENLSLEERVDILFRIEAEKPDEDDQEPAFFRQLKEMTFRGYFTSEKVCKEILQYDPVPGQYLGCIELEDAARIWAL